MNKVHHLNCGTMNVPGVPMVCHVLLVEISDGLVLVEKRSWNTAKRDVTRASARSG